MLSEEGAWVVIDHNRVDYEAIYGLMNNFCQIKL